LGSAGIQGAALGRHDRPQSFCTDLRQRINRAASIEELETLWSRHAEALSRLRAEWPELKTVHGLHYAEILGQVYEDQKARLSEAGDDGEAGGKVSEDAGDGGTVETIAVSSASAAAEVSDTSAHATAIAHGGNAVQTVASNSDVAGVPVSDGVTLPTRRGRTSVQLSDIDKSTLPLGAPKRLRDREHLLFVGSLPCLVCGRSPAHAHHLRFAQPRAMGSKVSDEWTVPLCPIHHRSLHDVGVEEEWWHAKAIDAKAEAENLWRRRHSTPAVAGGVMVAIAPDSTAPAGGQRPGPDPANSPIKTPSTDDHNRPPPINLRADMPRSR